MRIMPPVPSRWAGAGNGRHRTRGWSCGRPPPAPPCVASRELPARSDAPSLCAGANGLACSFRPILCAFGPPCLAYGLPPIRQKLADACRFTAAEVTWATALKPEPRQARLTLGSRSPSLRSKAVNLRSLGREATASAPIRAEIRERSKHELKMPPNLPPDRGGGERDWAARTSRNRGTLPERASQPAAQCEVSLFEHRLAA
jgi:hypothetical protein